VSLLERAGFEVLVARDGTETHGHIRRSQRDGPFTLAAYRPG
jgi:hypothetical protein